MKRLGIIFSLLLAILVLFRLTSPAQAMDTRGGDIIVIGKDEVIEDDLYIGASQLTLEGTVKGDLLGAGGIIIIESTGVVEGDLIVAAQGVEIKGTVKDDARAAGAVVKLSQGARVGGDFVAVGYTVETASDSVVGGDLTAFGGGVLIAGMVKKDAQVAAGGLQLNGQVDGNVDAEVGRPEEQMPFSPTMFMQPYPDMPAAPAIPGGLTLGPQAKVGGKLTYTADQEVSGAAAVAAGGVTRNPLPVKPEGPQTMTRTSSAVNWLLELIRSMVTLVLVGLLFAWVTPELLRRGAEVIRTKPLPVLGWGVVAYAGFLFAFLVLLIVVVLIALLLGLVTLGDLLGTAIGLGVFSGIGLSLVMKIAVSYLSKVLVGYLLGQLILGRIKPEWNQDIAWPLVFGVLLLALVMAIPVVGWLLSVAAMLFGLGALWLLGRQWWDGRRETNVTEAAVS